MKLKLKKNLHSFSSLISDIVKLYWFCWFLTHCNVLMEDQNLLQNNVYNCSICKTNTSNFKATLFLKCKWQVFIMFLKLFILVYIHNIYFEIWSIFYILENICFWNLSFQCIITKWNTTTYFIYSWQHYLDKSNVKYKRTITSKYRILASYQL